MNNYLYRLDLPLQVSTLNAYVALELTLHAIKPTERSVELIIKTGPIRYLDEDDYEMTDEEQLLADQDVYEHEKDLVHLGRSDYAEKYPENEIKSRHKDVLFRLFKNGSIQLIDHCGVLHFKTDENLSDIDICEVKLRFLDFVKFANAVEIGIYIDELEVSHSSKCELVKDHINTQSNDFKGVMLEPIEQTSVANKPLNFIHSTKLRRSTLTPVIELAQQKCRDPNDTAEIWIVLTTLAEKKHPPFYGTTEEGLQYLKNGDPKILNRSSLGKRLTRKKAAGKPL